MGSKLISRKLFLSVVVISCFLALVSFPIVAQSQKEINHQEILTNFYAQELVAHGAMFFAASVAAFRFITSLVGKVNNKRFMLSRRSIIFIFFSGILLGMVIFLGFRFLYYGVIANVTIHYRPPSENETLGEYTDNITLAILNKTGDNDFESLRWNLIKTCMLGIIDFHPFGILPISLYLGFFLSFLICYGFGRHSIEKPVFWFYLFFFLSPAAFGLVGALLYLSKIVDWIWISAFLAYYIGLPAVFAYWQGRKLPANSLTNKEISDRETKL